MSFPTLLRHSKFASYDSAIAQVYTTYGGNAHRGNWGFKRPLPLRTRNPFITVEAIDTKYQQTEWSNAFQKTRFIRRWNELGVDVIRTRTADTPWLADSEFSSKDNITKPRYLEGMRAAAIPNIAAMTTKEFTRYIEKLRSLRPQFKQYLRTTLANYPNRRDMSLFQLAQISETDYHKRFIAAQSISSYNEPGSQAIEPVPHRSGGLSYSHPTQLESMYTNPRTQPGFVLQKSIKLRDYNVNAPMLASFAGLTAEIRSANEAAGRIPLFDPSTNIGINPERARESVAQMRVVHPPKLIRLPNVVGRQPSVLADAKLSVKVTAEPDFLRANPYVPGSTEYVCAESALEKGVGKVGRGKGRGGNGISNHAAPMRLFGKCTAPPIFKYAKQYNPDKMLGTLTRIADHREGSWEESWKYVPNLRVFT
jgi:Mitochondrial ribosomal protein subunit